MDLLASVKWLLKKAWRPKYVKSPAMKRHLPKVTHRRGTAGHFSIHKVLTGKKGKRSRKAKPPKKDV